MLVQVPGRWAWAQVQPGSAEQTFRRGLELQQAGDLEGAIVQYQALLALYPEVAKARVNLGNAYASMGRYRDAIAQYEQALDSGRLPEPTRAQRSLGWLYLQAEEFEKGRDVLTKVIAEQPRNKEALQLLASCYFNLGQWQKVIELVSPLESELDSSPGLAYLLGAALMEDGKVERGAPLLEIALRDKDSAEARLQLGSALMEKGDYFGAAKQLERAIALDPKVPSLNGTYGKLLRTMTRHDDANEAFLRELEINPDDYDSNLFHGVHLFENEQKYEEALACFERALRARPGDAAARFQIGLVYNSSNRIEEALATVKGVIEEHPDFLDGHVTLTGLYYRLGRKQDAERHRALAERLRANRDGQNLIQLEQFSRAVELFERQKKADPSDPEPYFYAGVALSQTEDWQGAVAEFKEAVRLDPDNSQYAISYANALARTGEHDPARAGLESLGSHPWQQLDPRLAWILVDTYYRIGEHDQALQVLDFLAEQDPEDARVDLMSGQIHLLQGDYEKAQASAEGNIKKQTDNSLGYALLATARYQLGDKTGAKEAFLKAVDQDPDNPDHLRKLGALYMELGEHEPAIKYLERAKPAAADFPDITRLLERAYQARGDRVKGTTPTPQPVPQPKTTTAPSAEPGNSAATELVNRGEQALVAGNAREAVKLFEQAVEKDPENWPARSILADIFLSRGWLEQAHDHLSRMEAIDPQSAVGKHLMAQYWYQSKNYRSALDYAVQVKKVDAANAEVRNLLGNIYFSLGETQQAVTEYAAAVELEPERDEFQLNLKVARKRLQ